MLGVLLLFFSTVSISTSSIINFIPFPLSGQRINTEKITNGENFPASRPAVPIQKDKEEFTGSSTAVSAIVVDSNTKTILYNKNKGEVRPLASISKLMSAMVLLDQPINWASTTVIADSDYDGSDHNVDVGEKFTLEDLWHVALIGSSNTAIRALVRAAGFTTDDFAKKMNEKAKDLRLYSARFVEPTGLSDQNMANVYDTAKLLIDALKFDKIYKTVQIGEYYAHPLNGSKPKTIWSTNWLLTNWVPNDFKVQDIAGKTGYITDSGYNFAVDLTNDKKHTITVVVLGTASNEQRFSEARDLADWTFSHYLWPDDIGYKNLTE